MDGGVLFQGCRLEVGSLLGGPRGGGMVHGRCSVKLVLGTGEVIPCHDSCQTLVYFFFVWKETSRGDSDNITDFSSFLY